MKIRGNTVGTSNPRPDYKQDDSARADYIKNKPEHIIPSFTEEDYGKVLSPTATGLQWIAVEGGSSDLPDAEGVKF